MINNPNLILFFVCVTGLVFKCQGQYTFVDETVQYFCSPEDNFPDAHEKTKDKITEDMIKNHPLNKLIPEERWNLCIRAKNHTSLDGMETDDDPRKLEVNKVCMYHPENSNEKYEICLKCATIPIAVLCLTENSINVIKIVTEENIFLDQNFDVKVVEAVEFVQIEDAGEVLVNVREIRQEICIAAKTRIKRNITILPEKLSDIDVGIYNIRYPDGRTETNVAAIPCPSTPKMYLRADQESFVVILPQPTNKGNPINILPSRL